jgi:hypothetical protein
VEPIVGRMDCLGVPCGGLCATAKEGIEPLTRGTGVRPFFKHQGELFVAMVLAKAGLRDSARRVIQGAQATAKKPHSRAALLCGQSLYLLLGDRQAALIGR